MELRPFGLGRLSAPVLGQGTWQIEQGSRAESVQALRRGLDLGLTHIDTAEMYGAGQAEEVVAEAIQGRRDQVFLVSKVLPSNSSYPGTLQACESSLRRLKTDRLDCYLLHWRGSTPLAETFRAFEKLKGEGKILSWGVSNFDVKDLEDAVRAVGDAKISCNQVLYHLEERGIENTVLPWCEAHRISIVAYSPFGQGKFPSLTSKAGKVLSEIAAARSATPHQVALKFLIRRPSVFAIPKAGNAAHVEENAGAMNLTLTPEDLAKLGKAFPLGPPGGLAML